MIKKIILGFLCSLMGLIFLISGYTKGGFPLPFSSPIEPFEYTFVDLGFINWHIAPFVARILIGLEFLIGILLLLNLSLRKIAYKLGISVLMLFCIYLILLIAFTGNKGNCGCFGSYIQMTPLQALVKNSIMLVIFFTLYKFYDGWELNKKYSFLITIIFAGTFALPFIANPVALDYSEAYLNKPEDNFNLELDSLYNHATLTVPPKTLSKRKHIIAFMSLTCPHCRMAANKIRIIHERNAAISFYFVLNGDQKNLKPFFEDTHTEDIQHCILGKDYFIPMAGLQLPIIYFVNNSFVEHNVNYIDLDQSEIEKWLEK